MCKWARQAMSGLNLIVMALKAYRLSCHVIHVSHVISASHVIGRCYMTDANVNVHAAHHAEGRGEGGGSQARTGMTRLVTRSRRLQ